MARLTKDQNKRYEQYFLDCIESEDYNGFKFDSNFQKLFFVMKCFKKEFWNYNKNRNMRDTFKEYLQGLPSCIDLVFYNSDILALAEKINCKEYKTDKEQFKIIDNYFNFMSILFFKLCKKYGVSKF